jgi:hypothetical protein
MQTVSRQQTGRPSGGAPRRHPAGPGQRRRELTTRRERVLPGSEIAQLPRGQALVMIGPRWQLLPTLPYDRHPGFAQLAAAPRPALVSA